MQRRGWRPYIGPTRLQLAGRNGYAELRNGYAEVWMGPSMQMNVRGQGHVNMAAGAMDSMPGMNRVRMRTGVLTYADEGSGEYKNTQIIATGVGAHNAIRGWPPSAPPPAGPSGHSPMTPSK